MMNTHSRTTKRIGKQEQAEAAFVRLLADALRSGFYGAATLTLNVQDGHIQHVKIATERIIR